MFATSPASQEKHRNIGFGGNELKPPGRDHGDPRCLGDHRCRRTVADGVLDDGQQSGIVPRLCVDHTGRGQSCLRQAGRIEVVAAACPENGTIGALGFTRGDAGQEQRGSGVVDQRTGARRNLVQCART